MKRLAIAALLLLTACQDVDSPSEASPCDGGDGAFVQRSLMAMLARRPHGQAEIAVGAELIRAIEKVDPGNGRRAYLEVLRSRPEYRQRMTGLVLDLLRVARVGPTSLAECYGTRLHAADDGALAQTIRDNPPTFASTAPFTYADLIDSSLELGDISPVMRAHLFALVSRPEGCANVDPVTQEVARRDEVGGTFEEIYLNRDQVCLSCHNSEYSVTASADPALNRHFPVPGKFEQALFGAATGAGARARGALRFIDLLASDPMGSAAPICPASREDIPQCVGGRATCQTGGMPACEGTGMVVSCREDNPVCLTERQARLTPHSPWGAAPECGLFYPEDLPDDPTGVGAQLGSVTGLRASSYDLEAALHRGFELLRGGGLVMGENGMIADPDAAFAYLVAMNVADKVWEHVVGSSLTIATNFPRSAVARDVLQSLTDNFVRSGFSLDSLMQEVVLSPHFNPALPEDGCGEPFELPLIYNPWVSFDAPARRNSAGDQVHPVPARALLSATYEVLGWSQRDQGQFPGDDLPREDLDESCFAQFDREKPRESCAQLRSVCERNGECCVEYEVACGSMPMPGVSDEYAFQRSIGVFLRESERGFAGLDMQAQLSFEDRFGTCTPPNGSPPDAITRLLERAAGSTLREVVLGLKDLLLAEPILDADEEVRIAALLGTGLDAPFVAAAPIEAKLRLYCGTLLLSPQFLLDGLPAQQREPSRLGPSRETECAALESSRAGHIEVHCAEGHPSVQ